MKLSTVVFVIASIVIIIGGLKTARSIITPILLATTLTILLYPILQHLKRRGFSHGLSVLILVMAVISFFTVIFFIFYSSIGELIASIPFYQQLLQARLEPFYDWLEKNNIDFSGIISQQILSPDNLITLAQYVGRVVVASSVSIFFFLLILLFMLIESESMAVKFHEWFEKRDREWMGRISTFCRNVRSQYRIQATSNLFSATVVTVECLIFGVDFAFLWGVLTFFLGFIPNIGIIIATIPVMILAFILHGFSTMILMLAIGVALGQFMDNVITPRLMRGGLQLPILVSLLSFIFWTWMLGPLGALIAGPLTIFVRLLFESERNMHLLSNLLTAHVKKKVKVVRVK